MEKRNLKRMLCKNAVIYYTFQSKNISHKTRSLQCGNYSPNIVYTQNATGKLSWNKYLVEVFYLLLIMEPKELSKENVEAAIRYRPFLKQSIISDKKTMVMMRGQQ